MKNLTKYLDPNIVRKFNQLNIDISTIKIDIKNPEINIEQIANLMGINVTHKPLLENYYEDPFTFEVSTFIPTYRQRFTIAKMIINKLYDVQNSRDILKKEHSDGDFINRLVDIYLNELARKILIPEQLFKEVKENIMDRDKNISKLKLKIKLSKSFNVSSILIEEKL